VHGRWCYLYRAINSAGATIDFLLSALRDADAAKQPLGKALSDQSHPQPPVINTDLAPSAAVNADIEGRDFASPENVTWESLLAQSRAHHQIATLLIR
jgi:transposase-like protein